MNLSGKEQLMLACSGSGTALGGDDARRERSGREVRDPGEHEHDGGDDVATCGFARSDGNDEERDDDVECNGREALGPSVRMRQPLGAGLGHLAQGVHRGLSDDREVGGRECALEPPGQPDPSDADDQRDQTHRKGMGRGFIGEQVEADRDDEHEHGRPDQQSGAYGCAVTLSRNRTGHGATLALDGGGQTSCSQLRVTRVSSTATPTRCRSARGMPVVFGIVGRVIRWHGSSRHRSNAVPGRVLTSWSGRLALLATALGLVLMHHVVGAHQHASPGLPQAGPVAHSVADPGAAPPIAHRDHALAPAPKTAVSSEQARDRDRKTAAESSAAILHQHPDGSSHDHSGSLLHMCLAALLGTAILLLVLVLLAPWWRLPRRRTAERCRTASAEPRAPPTSSRLAELQLLRL